MCRTSRFVPCALVTSLALCLGSFAPWVANPSICSAQTPAPAGEQVPQRRADAPADIAWLTDYNTARDAAESGGKMLLIFFFDSAAGGPCGRFEQESLSDAAVRARLQDYICARLPLDAKIVREGKETVVLDHPAFAEMHRGPGIAVVDYEHTGAKYFGRAVSTFPLNERLRYTAEQVLAILNLPPGTLTQRTLIYAVRTHPEKPASAQGDVDPYLLEEAEDHSQYQATIRCQGHQFWETRFHRINARLPRGLTASEVCAESWPGQTLVEAAIECVRCWRSSAGHWSKVRARQRVFGYDMKCGRNGVWYATGIFGHR